MRHGKGYTRSVHQPRETFWFGEERGSRTEQSFFSRIFADTIFADFEYCLLRECHTVDFIGRGS